MKHKKMLRSNRVHVVIFFFIEYTLANTVPESRTNSSFLDLQRNVQTLSALVNFTKISCPWFCSYFEYAIWCIVW